MGDWDGDCGGDGGRGSRGGIINSLYPVIFDGLTPSYMLMCEEPLTNCN